MGKSSEEIGLPGDSCNGCNSTSCSACPSVPPETGGLPRLDRRQFGRTVVAGSMGAAMIAQPLGEDGKVVR